ALGVSCRVLPHSERHVRWRLHDAGARGLRLVEVLLHVIDGDMDVGRHVVPMRRTIRAARTTEHEGPFRDRELGMANHAVALEPETLGKAEGATEPADGATDVLVNQNWNNGSRGRGSIRDHWRLRRGFKAGPRV